MSHLVRFHVQFWWRHCILLNSKPLIGRNLWKNRQRRKAQLNTLANWRSAHQIIMWHPFLSVLAHPILWVPWGLAMLNWRLWNNLGIFRDGLPRISLPMFQQKKIGSRHSCLPLHVFQEPHSFRAICFPIFATVEPFHRSLERGTWETQVSPKCSIMGCHGPPYPKSRCHQSDVSFSELSSRINKPWLIKNLGVSQPQIVIIC